MMNPGEDAVARSRWLNWLPVLGREQRRALFENFQASGTWNVDFVVMMGLATALAAFGLLNNSPAAIIGAMLVAPLMSPLLGAGFALVQGNGTLFHGCIKAMARYATSPEAGAQVILASEVPVPLGFVEYIEGAVRSVVGRKATVRVTILQAAPGAELEAPMSAL